MKELGKGQYGSVFMVANKKTKELYALKIVLKKIIEENNMQKHIISEKHVLEKLNFPFTLKLYKSFQDKHAIYFLTNVINGIELFEMIREIGLINAKQTRFYVGIIILTLEYFHRKNIVYRDLKPENIMVDEQGYVYLIDMGVAKDLGESKGHTSTILGTPHYMAPEIIQGRSYNHMIDL